MRNSTPHGRWSVEHTHIIISTARDVGFGRYVVLYNCCCLIYYTIIEPYQQLKYSFAWSLISHSKTVLLVNFHENFPPIRHVFRLCCAVLHHGKDVSFRMPR